MNTSLHFRGSAEGATPVTANVGAVVAMGKNLGPDAVGHLAGMIGQAVEDGVARPINALTANVKATPGGGLAPKPDEQYDVTYRPNNGGLFGMEDRAPGKR